MNLRRLIYAGLALPFVLLFAVWLAYRFYTPDRPGPVAYSERGFVFFGEDGRRIPGTFSVPERANRAIILVPDARLDRDWNGSNSRMRTGARLARILASNGVLVVRYDPRGSLAREHFPDLNDRAADLATVHRQLMRRHKLKADRIAILAHGEGCAVAVRALGGRLKTRPRRIYLTACAYSGTVLESWGLRVLANMKRAGASPQLLKQARHELTQTLQRAGTSPAGAAGGAQPRAAKAGRGPKPHRDLLTFRKALRYLQSPQVSAWARSAARLHFLAELEAHAVRRRVRVDHYLCAFDVEITPTETAATEKAAPRLGRLGPYRLHRLSRTNHFLKVRQTRPQSGLQIVLGRLSPFSPLNPRLIRDLLVDH